MPLNLVLEICLESYDAQKETKRNTMISEVKNVDRWRLFYVLLKEKARWGFLFGLLSSSMINNTTTVLADAHSQTILK